MPAVAAGVLGLGALLFSRFRKARRCASDQLFPLLEKRLYLQRYVRTVEAEARRRGARPTFRSSVRRDAPPLDAMSISEATQHMFMTA